MPKYSDRQLAEARSIVSKYAANDGHRLVVGEDHRDAHGRALAAELIKRGRVTRLCLELPHNLNSRSHLPNVSESDMAMMERAMQFLSPGGRGASTSASTSSSSEPTSRVDYAAFFRELNIRLARQRTPIDLSTQEGWSAIKTYLDRHYEASGNPVKLSRLIEFAYAHGAEVQLVDGEYQWSTPQGSHERSQHMVTTMEGLPVNPRELLLVGSQHVGHMKSNSVTLQGRTHFIDAIRPEVRGSDDDSDDD
jgi:hypothetical protein